MEANQKTGSSTILQKLGKSVEYFEVVVLSVSVFALATLVIVNVFARTFYRSIYFAEEIAELLTILITFAGVSYAVRKARHIRMGAFFDAAPPKLQKAMIFIICAVSGLVMFLMAYYSYGYMSQARNMSHVTPALRLPYWTFVAIIPLGFFSAGIQYMRTIIKNIKEEAVWLSPEQQGEYEAEELQQMAEEYQAVGEELKKETMDNVDETSEEDGEKKP
ncbi:TRAP-type C4-dicarboxylate transport system, small permease component [Tindallia magadiensis]|uniref:TRAP-type C4-dicarboxylate transport system, small permease component n=1 Tax=Tindallia magadiensis TaxID=69895 RepID=A0A1I3C1F5_9FIRM|nr:TRAP transporter small permease [Tindallia magadiensis]SFH68387.1 TRAP-type C4-dicarboxylate transport system, small permease component [Tindallia magadiensis]